jgi:hypothetical protein
MELCKVSWARKDLVSSIIHNAERTAPQSSVLSVEINVKTSDELRPCQGVLPLASAASACQEVGHSLAK